MAPTPEVVERPSAPAIAPKGHVKSRAADKRSTATLPRNAGRCAVTGTRSREIRGAHGPPRARGGSGSRGAHGPLRGRGSARSALSARGPPRPAGASRPGRARAGSALASATESVPRRPSRAPRLRPPAEPRVDPAKL